jgi:anti-sigma B factor antagonist
MSIASEKHGDILVLRPLGMLDHRKAGELDQRATAAIAAGTSRVVFDLSALEHLSAEGLRVMLSVHKQLAASNGVVAIVTPPAEAGQLLDWTGMSALISTSPTLGEALAHAA